MMCCAETRNNSLKARQLVGCHWLGGLMGALAMAAANAASDDAETKAEAEALIELTRPQSRIEIGAGGLSQASFAAGNYSGLNRQGGYAIGNFDLLGNQYSYGNEHDDKTRWHLGGTNLGLHSRSLEGEYGQQGAYRFTFGFDEIPWLYSDSYQTPFLGAGSANLVLPSGFVRGADTTAMPALAASMRRFDVATTRQRTELGLSYWLAPEWELKLNLRGDARAGAKLRGAEFGSNGGNPRSVLLPEPIDSATQLIDASLAFSGESHRFTLAYHASIFRNRVASINWQNPYTSAPWTGGASGLPANFPLANGQLGVAPDNQFHQFAANGSYDFSNSTRLTLSASHGRMTQNETFLPYTINPGLTSTALPRNSLNGRIDTTFFNAKLSLRPVRGLSVNASLRYENRDNKTPQSEYIYVGGDIQLQPQPASNSDRIRTNLPRSRRQEQVTLEADYRLSAATAIKAGWDRDQVRRTFAEVESATENTYRVELRQGGTGPWSASASHALLVRRGTQYLYNLPYLASYTSTAYVNGLAAANGCAVLIDCVRTGPLQNKFYQADRERERTRLAMGYTPDGPISLQARLDMNRDRYPHSPYGVSDASTWSASADLAYVSGDDWSATLFHTVEDQRSRERSRQIAGANPAGASSADSDWVNRLADKSASSGLAVKYKGLLGGRIELNLDAITVRGRTRYATTVGTAVPAAQNPATALPDLVARSDNVTVAARYAVDRHNSIGLNYFYRRLSSADWAYQQVGTATLANLIGSNEAPPRYSQHGVGVSYIHVFR